MLLINFYFYFYFFNRISDFYSVRNYFLEFFIRILEFTFSIFFYFLFFGCLEIIIFLFWNFRLLFFRILKILKSYLNKIYLNAIFRALSIFSVFTKSTENVKNVFWVLCYKINFVFKNTFLKILDQTKFVSFCRNWKLKIDLKQETEHTQSCPQRLFYNILNLNFWIISRVRCHGQFNS